MFKEKVTSPGKRIAEALSLRKMKPAELSKLANVPKSSLSLYLKEVYEPKQDPTYAMAMVLNVSEAWLMGYDVPMERTDASGTTLPTNVRPVTLKKFPMIGKIACGEPIYADQDFETFIEASSEIKADFCLTAQGDSMTGAGIHDGDVVFVKEQPIVENGQVAAVIIDDEATLKRWYYYPDKQKLVLNPENPKYEPT